MDKLILALIIATVICIVLIIVFSISDAKKAKKVQTMRPLSATLGQDEPTLEETNTPTEVLATDKTEDTKVKVALDVEPIKNEEQLEETVTDDINGGATANTAYTGAIPTINLNPPILQRTNPPIKKKETQDYSESTAVGFVKGSNLAEEYKRLLETIATELQKKANNSGEFIINYLNNNCKDIIFKGDSFVLRNEELICNGILLEDSEKYALQAGDRVTIRFCVSFTVPDGYDIQVIANTVKLNEMGLLLKNVVNARDDATSIRAVLGVTRPCIIKKEDELFRVKVIKEVVV